MTNLCFVLLFFGVIVLDQKFVPKYVRGFRYDTVIRYLIFFLPFLVPFIVRPVGLVLGEGRSVWTGVAITVVASLIALAIQIPSLKILFNKDIIALMEINGRTCFLMEISLIGSVIFEELFYRKYLVGALQPSFGMWTVFFSAALFSVAHLFHVQRKLYFKGFSYLILFFLGSFYSYAYLLTGHFIVCILGHILYNLPQMLNLMLRFRSSRIV